MSWRREGRVRRFWLVVRRFGHWDGPRSNRREERQRFWRLIAEGLSSEDAAVACGVSMPLEPRWFREGGGMPPISLDPPSGRYLSFAEREEIAALRAQGCGVGEIARRLGRARRRFRGSCGATRRPVAAAWTPRSARAVPSRRDLMQMDAQI